MRNLRNGKHTRHNVAAGLTATAWDTSNDSIILAFGPNENDTISIRRLLQGQSPEEAQTIASWDAPSPHPDIPVDRVLDLQYFPDTRSLCVVLAGGDIVIVREDAQPGEDRVEIVGSVDAGIGAAVWSPDEEILALATGADTLLFMTRDFEGLANITLTVEDLKVSNHVSVGWGKKETQFKGRGVAKTVRDPTVPEHVDEGILSSVDDRKTTISWRGDGQYVAVNSILQVETMRRVIRVYSREGTLESISEPVNGLEGALSWKPSGQLLAGVRRYDGKIDVVFFERNGLRHGEFTLRLDTEQMLTVGATLDLRWNVESTVLAVSMKDRVQLWAMSNYHYYLKQEILLNPSASTTTHTTWHPERPLHLVCWNDASIHGLSYNFEVSRGPITPPHDNGLVAVIDGKNLKVTPLRMANIPPPMAFEEIALPDAALDVAINHNGTEIIVLHNGLASIWSCDYDSKPAKKAALKSTVKISPEQLRGSSSIQISERDATFLRTDHDRISYAASIEALVQTNGETFAPSVDISDTSNMTWRGTNEQKISFRLSDGGILHIQNDMQALRIPGCTSFLITPMHLIYTTSQHLLKFVHLHTGNLNIPPDEPEMDERCRSVERGAKIVTAMPSVYALVLQMPRGNLETIYPRALVLAGIRQSLRDRDYKKAFLICRTQRVDMNILHDYAPGKFMRDVGLLVKQVKKVEYIDLFLSSLSEEDVSATLYRETLAPEETLDTNGFTQEIANSHAPNSSSKMNRICDTFLRELQINSATRLQNIVTAHVCKTPPDLESGLRLVSELRKEGDQERLEQAVEHICFLADTNQLYDTALGIYDLDVALLVAQQSQKDPREYLPYLQSLHDMQPLRQKFTIDDDLKRYQRALSHLSALEAFDELQAYTIKHELYSEAIDLYRYDNTRLKELTRLYADYLSTRSKFKEAGIAYEYISDHAAAYEAFRQVTMWRECLLNAQLVPLSEAELLSLAQDLAGSLEESKNFREAAPIHLDYLDDLKGSARLLCKAYSFAEAMQQVTLRRRAELLKDIIDPGLIDGAAAMTELLAEMKSQLAAQVPRLRELRQRKAEDPMAFLDGADGGDGDVPDNISLAPTDASTSGGTFMTRYTNRSMSTLATNATRKTSKNRRREERKRARGKKGTVYEEEYLINSIARLIDRLNDVGEDVGRLVDGLMRRSMRELAMAVQAAMDGVVGSIKACTDEVFEIRKESGEKEALPVNETARPWGGQGVLWEALTSAKREAPALKSFERLTLIPR